LEVVHTGRFSP